MKTSSCYQIDHHISENNFHDQNPLEGMNCELRRKWYCVMVTNFVAKKLRGFGYRYAS